MIPGTAIYIYMIKKQKYLQYLSHCCSIYLCDARDVFYELVRKWEDSHSAAGWNMEEHMGDRIRYEHINW